MAEAAITASEDAPLLVASIDFGTTYSGCAFSFRSDFDKNPCTVSCVNTKYGEKQGFQAQRVPTCILFSPDRQFHSFGFDARKHYAELSVNDRAGALTWYFFENFKVQLLSEETRLQRDLDLLDETEKKSMKALDVIAEAIRYLKNLLLRELQEKSIFVKGSDIVWVLTVPAIWDDAARQFMREAAVKAGIKSDRLRLALEPEAAATFCHYHFLSKKEVFAQTGKRFMTVDCGGGTVDISVLEVAEQGKLKQLHKPHGAACGGTKVDDAFLEMINKVLGPKGMMAVDNMERVKLLQNFELAKGKMGKANRVEVELPQTMVEAVEKHLKKSPPKGKIGMMSNKMRLPKDLYITFFNESKEGIIKAMKEVLSNQDVSPVDVILLVGGLAKSSIIVDAVKEAFPDRRVLVPPSPDLTVLMGAVQFGHCPEAIATRVSPYTYGVSTTYESRPGDDPSKVEKVDGVERTEDKATRSSARRRAPLLVASIDFGTTYSGCAFSFRHDFESRPCSVSCVNVTFTRDGKEFQAEKVPTCILFNPQGEFDTFGFEAQLKYSEMVAGLNEEVDQWYFFEGFKMELREREEQDLTRDLDLLDQTKKKSMKALDVFAEAIRYLKDLLLRQLQKASIFVAATDMFWVLTVPAIWNDAARQFMREAAVKAGIESEKLMLALEPEAASIFCHYQSLEGQESFTGKGKSFMVVDCGGGTVDISVFRDVGDGTLIQEHKPHGAHCGGTKVDDAFRKLLSEILDMEGLASINNKELVELKQNFEIAKQAMNGNDSVWVRIPNALEKVFERYLATSKYKTQLRLTKSNLCLPHEIFEPFFKESKEGIIKAMKEVLSNQDVSPVILLVGGLAKSTIIVDAVKEAFPDRRVLVPPSPDLTVLMGAVQFGHCPQAIATRVSPYTYGVSTTYESRPGDDPSKVEKVDGVERTEDKATRSSARRRAPLMVASIDFGTTYSGCAFSFRSDFESRPCSVSCVNVKFTRNGKVFQAERVPTCILFNPQGEFDTFGFEAQLKYSEMVAGQNEEVDRWYFFEGFKMELREREEEDLTRDLDLLDQTKKKSMKALDVIAEAIRYLKNLLLRELKAKTSHIKESDIVWILTVPAIWNDAARQFMREAAVKAEIASEKLMLALEPEAASIFCHYRTMEGRELFAGNGKRFMVVDCGGGTVDISVFRDVGDGTLIQEHKPHGAHCGGTKVDDAFEELLLGILKMKGLASINNKELVEMKQNFEVAKEEMNGKDTVWVRIPNTMEKALGRYLATSEYKTQLWLRKSTLSLPCEVYEAFFTESKNGIMKAMNEVLSSEDVSAVDVILLVGGLAKSTIIVGAVKEAFPDRRVLVPPSPDLTVLMGAVQFGHCPEAIATRVSPYTYGVSTTYVSRPGDDPSKVEEIDRVKRTKDIFEVLIKVNERVSIDEEKKPFQFKPIHPNQKKMTLDLYRTLSADPKYVTDAGCEKEASIEVDMPDTTGDKRRRVQVSLSVSGTELRVVAKDGKTGKTFPAKCDFLENKAKSYRKREQKESHCPLNWRSET